MSSLTAVSSVGASIVTSNQSSLKGSNDSSDSLVELSQQSSVEVNAEASASATVSSGDGDSVSISQEAQVSLKAEQVNQLLVNKSENSVLLEIRNNPGQSNSPDKGGGSEESSGSDDASENPGNSDDKRSGESGNSGESNRSRRPDRSRGNQGQEDGSILDPEATAKGILEDTTALFSAYVEQNGGEVNEETVEGFVNVLERAIPEGFSQARGVLDERGEMTGGLSSDISEAFELVEQGLNQFQANMKAQLSAEAGASARAAGSQASANAQANANGRATFA